MLSLRQRQPKPTPNWKEYRQKGFATNMAKTIIDYGFKQQNLVKILGLVKEENFASKKILEKIGYFD